ncbi:MAG TPA: hypothetical protein VHN80_10290 [Kineosporiaceae bacterium]|nr:hypothetical protein [Kineosporiaceae bacterium]
MTSHSHLDSSRVERGVHVHRVHGGRGHHNQLHESLLGDIRVPAGESDLVR